MSEKDVVVDDVNSSTAVDYFDETVDFKEGLKVDYLQCFKQSKLCKSYLRELGTAR